MHRRKASPDLTSYLSVLCSLPLQIYTLLEDMPSAIRVYMEALQHSPENTDVLTTLGLLYLRYVWLYLRLGAITIPSMTRDIHVGRPHGFSLSFSLQ